MPSTGGRPALIETVAKAAIAVGVDGLFLETHPRPTEAKSDAANMLPLERLEAMLEKLVKGPSSTEGSFGKGFSNLCHLRGEDGFCTPNQERRCLP